jgi:predicted Fe-Mo cluster-binding NifX family protein
MKIAVPTQDGSSISDHFGRSKSFLVFEVEEGKIADCSLRANQFTAHAQGECHDDHGHGQPHGHDEIVEALKDCEAVLCYGMGRRAAAALEEGGIRAFVLGQRLTPQEAVQQFVAGRLPPAGDFCACH